MPDAVPHNPDRDRLFERFVALGIDAPTVDYPAHSTVEEGKAIRGDMAGTFTKNLLLRDKKDRLFLLAIHEDRVLDLKTLHQRIGATGRLGFASAEKMQSILNVSPGSLTPLALLADHAAQVTCVLDRSLLAADLVNFHPLINTESTSLRPADLLCFLESCGHKPLLVDLEPDAP
jgi:Ala-tRNA(Pro) deacylase